MQSNNTKEYSDSKAQEIDDEVHRIIMDGYNKAKRILQDNIEILHTLSQALLEFETIDGEDVEMIVKGGSIDDMKKRHEDRDKKMAKEQKEAREAMEKKAREEEREETEKITGGMGDPVTA
jgi:N-acetylglucosamine kinase-like BadF-type ATPase